MAKTLNKILNATSFVVGSGLALYGEHLQELAKEKIIPYDLYVGHLSDYASNIAFPSLYLFIASLSKNNKTKNFARVISLGATTIWSFGEFYGALGKPDSKDILAYFLGLGTAMGIDYFSEKINFNKIN